MHKLQQLTLSPGERWSESLGYFGETDSARSLKVFTFTSRTPASTSLLPVTDWRVLVCCTCGGRVCQSVSLLVTSASFLLVSDSRQVSSANRRFYISFPPMEAGVMVVEGFTRDVLRGEEDR